jgi:serine/threonine protein kinase
MELQPGSTLGPYVLGARLGAGGMGEVYAAMDPRLGREVAIKVLPAEGAASPRALVRFEREARAVAALSHPNVLVVHDVGAAGDVRYVVTELLQGESLHARLERGPIGWRQTVALGADVADGLQAAHDRGIVHRDLKPANLFLTREGRIKILDFGVARFIRGDDLGGSGERTLPGSVLGSLGYMSPEPTSTAAATSFRSAACSTRCSPASGRSAAPRCRRRSPPSRATSRVRYATSRQPCPQRWKRWSSAVSANVPANVSAPPARLPPPCEPCSPRRASSGARSPRRVPRAR